MSLRTSHVIAKRPCRCEPAMSLRNGHVIANEALRVKQSPSVARRLRRFAKRRASSQRHIRSNIRNAIFIH